jgi:hypothetical protein
VEVGHTCPRNSNTNCSLIFSHSVRQQTGFVKCPVNCAELDASGYVCLFFSLTAVKTILGCRININKETVNVFAAIF